jgi:hypothetical protein
MNWSGPQITQATFNMPPTQLFVPADIDHHRVAMSMDTKPAGLRPPPTQENPMTIYATYPTTGHNGSPFTVPMSDDPAKRQSPLESEIRAMSYHSCSMPPTSEDPIKRQVGGDHYVQHGRMQPWEIWKHYKLNPWEASAVKYILRRKDPSKRAEDLRKAAHCLEYLAQMVEAGEV